MIASFPRSFAPAFPALDHNLLDASISEGADAASGTGTRYAIGPGDSFFGYVDWSYDTDWVAVTLTAGQTYRFEMDGIGLSDTYLELLDRNGNRLAYNDDFGSWDHSEFTYTATTSGTFYLVGSGYSSDTGSYEISYAATGTGPGPVPGSLTMTQIAEYLTDGYWEDNGEGRRSYDATQGSTLTCDISDLGAAEQRMARMALNAWSEVTGIRFDTSSRAGAAANIQFVNDDPSGAYAGPTSGYTVVTSSLVNIPADWAEGPNAGFNTYFYQTYLHEIGHALGLGHAGPYNGSATWGIDNAYANDSWQATVMSYFSQEDNLVIDASLAYVMTPMIADIIAVQDLYGTPRNLNNGNSVWGEGSTIGGAFGMANGLMVARQAVTMTIFDQGGNDQLCLATDSSGLRINLSPGTVSSVYGLVGNLSIAAGTVIETVVCGTAADVVWGNGAANWLRGNGGNDTLLGGLGNDTLNGGLGADRLVGGMGDDVFYVTAGDVVVEVAGGGRDRVITALNTTLAASIEDLLLQGAATAGAGNALDNRMIGTAAANRLLGAAGNDQLEGGAGNDALDGGLGNDTLIGGAGADRLVGGWGNDVFHVDAADMVVELAGGGRDRIVTGLNTTLAANLEDLQLQASARAGNGNALDNRIGGNGVANTLNGMAGHDALDGGFGNDTLLGGIGNDTLAGGAGADRLVGGLGNDVYTVDAADIVAEAAGGGIDRVVSAGSIVLAFQVEDATLTGTAAAGIRGNALANTLTGNAAANLIEGGGGQDVLRGGGGADVFLFRAGSGGRILDWQDDIDTLRVVTIGPGTTEAAVLASAVESAAGVTLTIGGARLLVGGTTLDELRDDLVFVV